MCVTGETHTLHHTGHPPHTHTHLCTFIHQTLFPPLWNQRPEPPCPSAGRPGAFHPSITAERTWPLQLAADLVATCQLEAASAAGTGGEFHDDILSAVVLGKQQMFAIKPCSRLANVSGERRTLRGNSYLLFFLVWKICPAAL